MKTITIAAWYMSVAIGNLIVILVAQTKIFESRVFVISSLNILYYIYCCNLYLSLIIYCIKIIGNDVLSLDTIE